MDITSSKESSRRARSIGTGGRRRSVALALGLALVAAGCSDSGDGDGSASLDPVGVAEGRVAAAERAVTAADEALVGAHEALCASGEDYVRAIDRYGKLFTNEAATVGDVKEGGADLVEPRDAVADDAADLEGAKDDLAAAEQELVDAQAELAEAVATASSVPDTTPAPTSTTTTTLIPPATVERVRTAEEALAEASAGITDATPLADATVEFNSAAFALEITWLKLLVDGGCVTDDRQAEAVRAVTDYTIALQSQLQVAGYFTGEVDGVYGPETVDAVKRLQADGGLPETGLVDAATARALDEAVAAVDEGTAAEAVAQTAALQTVLSLTGHWTGAIDGQWTDELTEALVGFQTELGVPATGAVDAATLAAFQQALTEAVAETTTTTTAPPDAEAPTGTAPEPSDPGDETQGPTG